APRTKRRLRSRLPCRFIRSDEIRMSSCPQPLSATERIPIGRNVQYENSHVDLLLLLANRNSDNREIAALSSAPSMVRGIDKDAFLIVENGALVVDMGDRDFFPGDGGLVGTVRKGFPLCAPTKNASCPAFGGTAYGSLR